MIEYVVGDTLPSLTVRLVEKGEPTCPGDFDPRDLTEVEVRALVFKNFKDSKSCNVDVRVATEDAFLYRQLTKLETDLLTTTSVNASSGDPAIVDPVKQPAGPQRLSLEISNFTTSGTVSLTGETEDGDAVTENVAVAADGTLFTTKVFASIDDDGISLDGEYDVRIFVHDGRARLDWQAGDLDEVGLYGVIFEEHVGGDRQSSKDPLLFSVDFRRSTPAPQVTGVSPDPVSAGATLTVNGKNFLDATKVELVPKDGSAEILLTNLVVVSDVQVTGDVPGGTAAADYWVRVTTPAGVSELFSDVTVS